MVGIRVCGLWWGLLFGDGDGDGKNGGGGELIRGCCVIVVVV